MFVHIVEEAYINFVILSAAKDLCSSLGVCFVSGHRFSDAVNSAHTCGFSRWKIK